MKSRLVKIIGGIYNVFLKEVIALKIGLRTWKTVFAVFICFLIDDLRQAGIPFYAAIAAVLCVQHNKKDSFKAAKNREIATIIGGIWGMSFLLFEKNIYYIQSDILRHLVLSLMLIPIIKLSVWFKQTQGTFLMCVVFLCITVTHGNDVSPVQFALNRIIDTTIGICTALLVNCLPLHLKCH